jgi:hypothetical protein
LLDRGVNGLKFSPGQQVLSRNHAFAHFTRPLGDDLNSFAEFVRVCQKKIQIEATGCIQDLDRCGEMRSFPLIRSP